MLRLPARSVHSSKVIDAQVKLHVLLLLLLLLSNLGHFRLFSLFRAVPGLAPRLGPRLDDVPAPHVAGHGGDKGLCELVEAIRPHLEVDPNETAQQADGAQVLSDRLKCYQD